MIALPTADEVMADPDAALRRLPREVVLTSEGRRRLTRYRPDLFALVYFRSSLRMPETDDRITLAEFHRDIADAAVRWAAPRPGFRAHRDAWVAPRGAGKSTWSFLILPAWALAHGHRKFVAAFADAEDQAKLHLATFKRHVQLGNELLRRDFPELCRPARRITGVSDADRQDLYLAQSGVAFSAKGLQSSTLGLKVGDQRPDVLLFDDIEPKEGDYSQAQADTRLRTIRSDLLPMNPNAIVQFVGTTVMAGSIIDQIVSSATRGAGAAPPWVAAENIRTHYFPALYTADDGTECSFWPARFPVAELQQYRRDDPAGFAKSYMNHPVADRSAYWTPGMFRTGEVDGCTRHIISVDPAVTSKRSSDFTGIAVLSYSPASDRVLLRHTEQVRQSPADLRLHLIRLCSRFPEVGLILVETNQGGDTWKTVLHDMPAAVDEVKQSEKKESRWAKSMDLWTSGRVLHDPAGDTGPFERQAVAVPFSANDDVVDAVTSGVLYMMRRFRVAARPRPQRSRVHAYV